MDDYRNITSEQRRAARVAGVLYVLQMAVAIFGEIFVRGRLIVRGDATQTAQNILAHEQLFRFSIAGDLFVYTGVIVLLWALYVVVRPVNKNLALLAVLFRTAENAILCVATACSLVMLKLIGNTEYLKPFEPAQLHALARLALNTQGLTMNIAFILLGLGSTVFAWLLLKSGYVPKVIAAWGIFSSLVLAIVTLVIIVLPGLGAALGLTYMMPMFLYEVGLGLWLAVKGIRSPASAT